MKRGRLDKEEEVKRLKALAYFIFNFRYATLGQIHAFINLVMNLSYARRLVSYALKNGYLNRYYEPTIRTKIYHLTQKGKDLIYGIEPLAEHYRFEKSLTGLNTFIHHNILVQVYFMLKCHLEVKEWVCEWVLRINKKRHEKIPDALLVLPAGLKVAIEAESRYKKLAVLKSLVTMYRYDIEKAARYDAVLIVASSRLQYEGLKLRLFAISPEFFNERFLVTDIGLLEQGMCFHNGNSMHLEEAFGRLKERLNRG